MAWEHLSVTKPHLVYIILGGFTSLFMLCSSIIKERLYIGEATIATICGIIFGPHAANLINPGTWGNTDLITIEFARIVLVVQCFAVGVELPKAYMERHWKSVVFLLVPVMTFGWLVTSLFIWGLTHSEVNWLDSLCIAACVTATDPVLASSVVGKGKFAKRVPKHLRDLLSAESGCNDGMAFPFIYLAIYVIRYHHHPNEVAFHWFCYSILYECIFGAVYGVLIGYLARRAIRYAHDRDLMDRESFLVFYFVLALFCAGSGSMLGMDDLLIGFACGVGFSNDGWFLEKTEESHVSNVIDLLINLAFFVYFGTIIPWEQFNFHENGIGLTPWRLVVLGILVLLFRRIPIMILLKPAIPDIKNFREALFAGHFGPIGVGAIFVAIMARAELEHETTTPLAQLPPSTADNYNIIVLIWPITTFLVICSIVVHGSSIAVYTLGKHINTLQLTLSYTQANEEATWMDRLPRIQSRSKSSMSLRRPYDETDSSMDEKAGDIPPGLLSPVGFPGNFLRRQREEESQSRNHSRASSLRPVSRKKKRDPDLRPGGPVSDSAIMPQPRNRDHADMPSPAEDRMDASETIVLDSKDVSPDSSLQKEKEEKPGVAVPEEEVYQEGDHQIIEDEEGNVLEDRVSREEDPQQRRESVKEVGRKLMKEKDVTGGVAQTEDPQNVDEGQKVAYELKDTVEHPQSHWRDMAKKFGALKRQEGAAEEQAQAKPKPKRGPARAYQYGNTVIVEDEDGEVIKKYDIPVPKRPGTGDRKPSYAGEGRTRQTLQRMGTYLGMGHHEEEQGEGSETARKKKQEEDKDDEQIRFTITAGGRRMSKAEFLQEFKKMDPKGRAELMEDSDAPEAVKQEARKDTSEQPARREHRSPRKHADASGPSAPHAVPDDHALGRITSTEDTVADKAGSKEASPGAPEGPTLVDSDNEDVPFHSVADSLEAYHTRARETAAQRRRGRLSSPPRNPPSPSDDEEEEEESDLDASPSRVPARMSPVKQKKSQISHMDEGETAAERRRREGALGLTQEGNSESEDEEEADDEAESSARGRQPGFLPSRSIQFAEPAKTQRPTPEPAPQTERQEAPKSGGWRSRLKWAENRGRKR